MKKIYGIIALATLGLTVASSAFAAGQKLECKGEIHYLDMKKTLVIDLSDKLYSAFTNEEGKWEISWSQTECEDGSSITFDRHEYQDLLKGKEKAIYGELKHGEPDADLRLTMSCKLRR